MIRVYTASKLTTAEVWKYLHQEWPDVYFHARWLKHMELKTPNTHAHAADFWLQDEEDVRSADAVLVYGREGEKLRGALVEAGMAIALNIPVVVVGEHPDYSTWQYHPGVTRVPDLVSAKIYLEGLQVGWRRRAA